MIWGVGVEEVGTAEEGRMGRLRQKTEGEQERRKVFVVKRNSSKARGRAHTWPRTHLLTSFPKPGEWKGFQTPALQRPVLLAGHCRSQKQAKKAKRRRRSRDQRLGALLTANADSVEDGTLVGRVGGGGLSFR